ncbi:Peroxiredoxin [Yoonia tamlensis]|uniref:Peroxiredoxin n=1 Tax=Yoonia tamlensis TaxID=390270 RepID=A0A1I6FNV6_9RHOB|nr:deiodinase-like protein [Yoonia tamlensis]SFR31633.1 Peroxiredoxin [Yoonia tamlensis]
MGDYNYATFAASDYDFTSVNGPALGAKAPDIVVTTLAGTQRQLLEFDADFLVLELGSITCPLFQTRRKAMTALARKHSNAVHAVLYVREAHPGVAIPVHQDFAQKHSCANRLAEADGETREILIDGIDGAGHRAFGGMPNAVFIINRNGCVVFRASWNNPGVTARALEALVAGRTISAKNYFRPATPKIALETFRKAGKGSARDFLKSLPALIWANVVRRNLGLLFGRAQDVSGDMAC